MITGDLLFTIRHVALKALDERLNKAHEEPESWPSIDDEASSSGGSGSAGKTSGGGGVHVVDIAEESAVPAAVGKGNGSGQGGMNAIVEPAESAS